MEMLALLALALVLTILIGSACGLVALSKLGRLQRDVAHLEQQVTRLLNRSGAAEAVPPATKTSATDPAQASPAERPSEPLPGTAAETPSTRQSPAATARPQPSVPPAPPAPPEPGMMDALADNLRRNWMTWLGGACVSLAGIFLVRYSMDQGWLGPLARVVAALLTGTALLATAEYLRRGHGGSQPALSALAGAGCITLYGALLAAVKMYGLIGPGTAFALMALVALGTMALALLHGPVLAAFGILGAYLVPVLVSTGSGEIVIALVYALIISLSALLVLRYVYRGWLWWGFVLGAMGWWSISLTLPAADGARSLYLAALAYLVAAVPAGDWLLRNAVRLDYRGYRPLALLRALGSPGRSALLTWVLLTLATGATIVANPDALSPWLLGLPMFVLMLWLARTRDAAFALPWLTLLATVAGWLLAQVNETGGTFAFAPLPAVTSHVYLGYLAVFAAVAAGMALWLFAANRRPATWASLATLGPMLFVTLAYLLKVRPETNASWGWTTAAFAVVYLAIATSVLRKRSIESLVVWLFVGGHFGLGLAAAMFFESASLTLAIAAQTVSLAWIIRSFRLPDLGWLLKLVLSVVIVRLTFNPWLPEYPVGVHWSLWTYGGSAALAAVGAWGLRAYPTLGRWAEGAALHLFVLAVWSEVRYQLYDGAVYAAQFSFAEAVLTMGLAATMGLVYHRRAGASQSLAWLYRLYARGLAALSLLLYGFIVTRTLLSERWVHEAVSATPVANVLLAAFGLPVLFGLLYAHWFAPAVRTRALQFAGIAAFVFVSLQVRHLWAGTVRLDRPDVVSGELYTYSAVWLVIALVTLLAGSWRFGQSVYRAGMILLGIVIAKLFLIDLSDLDGLLRVASFMGLGLSLLGVAFLHQRLGGRTSEPV